MPSTPTVATELSRLGHAVRRNGANSPEAAEARRALAAAKITAFVERSLADAPPLTDDQCDRIIRALSTEH